MPSIPKWTYRWTQQFAYWPTQLDSDEWVWFKHYWVYETFIQNPYNIDASVGLVYERISREDYVIRLLKKPSKTLGKH